MILLKLITITSLLVLGWKIVTSEGMLLHKVALIAEQKVHEGKIYFELILCPWCMSSLWSLFGFAFAYGLGVIELNWKLLLLYPLCVCGSSLVCGLTWTIYQTINAIKERNESEIDAIYDFSKEEEEYEERYFENQRN